MRLQASITKSTLSAVLRIMYGMEGSHLNHSQDNLHLFPHFIFFLDSVFSTFMVRSE